MKLIPKPLRRSAQRFMAEEVYRLIYGNMLGPKNNRIGRKRLQEAQRHAEGVPEVSESAELRRDGCLFYRRIDPDRLATVHREYVEAINCPELTFKTSTAHNRPAKDGEPVYRIILQNPGQAMPAALALIDSEMQQFVMSYYGANFRLHSMVAWRNFHVPAEVSARTPPYSLRWHVDNHPSDTLKLFIALDEIGEDDGPLHFVTRQRTDELIRMGYRSRRRYGGTETALEDPVHVMRLTGPAGTAAFCNTTTNLHRAGVPTVGRCRDILQFRFEAATEPFSASAPLKAANTPMQA